MHVCVVVFFPPLHPTFTHSESNCFFSLFAPLESFEQDASPSWEMWVCCRTQCQACVSPLNVRTTQSAAPRSGARHTHARSYTVRHLCEFFFILSIANFHLSWCKFQSVMVLFLEESSPCVFDVPFYSLVMQYLIANSLLKKIMEASKFVKPLKYG